MDIVAIIQLVIKESATAALALFAIWSLKRSYEEQLQERTEHAEALKVLNETLTDEVKESTVTRATATEVIRRNTEVLDKLVTLLEKGER